MDREYTWMITYDNLLYTIICEKSRSGSGWDIWLDDDFVQHILPTDSGEIDVEFELLGQPCRFVRWDVDPDIVWQGKLLTAKQDYNEAKKRHYKSTESLFWGIFPIPIVEILIGIVFKLYVFIGIGIITFIFFPIYFKKLNY